MAVSGTWVTKFEETDEERNALLQLTRDADRDWNEIVKIGKREVPTEVGKFKILVSVDK